MSFSSVLAAVGSTPAELAAFAFLLMLLYSFLGWCGEMVYCSLGQRRLCEKRGFLNGPICPIYGHGALLVLWALDGGCANPLLTFLLGALMTSALEYATSFAMEKLFHMRWWDYSARRFNLNGRVCLRNSVLFGAACVLLCHGPGPALAGMAAWFFARGTGVRLAAALGLLYLADIVLSVRGAIQIRLRLEQLHAIHEELAAKLEQLKAERQQSLEAQRARLEEAMRTARQSAGERRSEAAKAVQSRLEPLSAEFSQRLEAARAEAQQRIKALCEKSGLFERRLIDSFPTMRSPLHGEALEKLRAHLAGRRS